MDLKRFIKKRATSFLYFYKYLKYKLFVVIVLSILLGVIDGFGLTMFLPLLQMSSDSSNVNKGSLGKLDFVISTFSDIGIDLNLSNTLIFIVFFFVLKGIINYWFNLYKAKITQSFIANMRTRLANLLTDFSYKIFVSTNIGRIQNNFTNEVVRVTTAYINYSGLIQSFSLVIVYMIFAFALNWNFAILITIGGTLTNLIYKTIYKKTKEQSVMYSRNSSDFQGVIMQYLHNFKYLKATGNIKVYTKKLDDLIKKIEENNFKISKLSTVISSTREPLLVVVVCMVIFIQVRMLNGNLSSILISLLFFYRALNALMAVQNSYNSFLGVSGSLNNIETFEEELKKNKEDFGKQVFLKFEKSINIEGLFFSFNDDNYILDEINLEVKKNQTIAFVGESGSGKTTLVNLICGLFKPTKGNINVDGSSIFDYDIRQYQNKIGYISQDPVIFNDTIFNNVTFWDEKSVNNYKKFEAALQKASIFEFVNTLSEKEETILGNNGVNLSGGQKQRISIAREIYKEIDILVLDEATSALDSDNEKVIKENIDAMHGNLTIIIIAHRLSTIRNVDSIYLLEKGKITSQGTFDELIVKSERFKKMVELQEI